MYIGKYVDKSVCDGRWYIPPTSTVSVKSWELTLLLECDVKGSAYYKSVVS